MDKLDELKESVEGLSKGVDKLIQERTDLKLFLVSINKYEEFEKWKEGRDHV